MGYFKGILAILITVYSAHAALAADKYTIDAVHSSVGFSVKHMMVSNVKGRFADFSGEIIFDPNDISKAAVTVTIKSASITTNNERRDGHLRSGDFFDAEKYPEITFRSTRVEKKGDGYVAYGAFTMRGVTKEIALPFTLNGPIKMGKTQAMGVEAGITINRQDYGVSWNRVLDIGGVTVSDEVKVELNIEAKSG